MSRIRCYGVLMLLSRFVVVVCVLAIPPSTVMAQAPPTDSLTLQAALDRAVAANPTIAAARLRNPIDVAVLAVARERHLASRAMLAAALQSLREQGYVPPGAV